MKILFLTGGDDGSPERKLAREAEKLIGADAEVVWHDPALPFPAGDYDGVWIFTHEEEGGCPPVLMHFLEDNFPLLRDLPATASGIGGKEGGMNAVTEILGYFEEHGGRVAEGEPLCIPLRSSRFDLEQEEKMDLFFVVDGFIKYCGMDDSESRKIAFSTVVEDCLKLLALRGPLREGILSEEGLLAPLPEDAPPELKELPHEIAALTSDYEIEEDELLAALRERLKEN